MSIAARKAVLSNGRKPEQGRYFIQAVGKALDLLDLLGQIDQPISLGDLSRRLAQSKSSTFRILSTLEERGLVERKSGDLYSLTHSRISAGANQPLEKLLRIADLVMRELTREFRETVSLAYLFEHHIGVVKVMDSPQKIHMGNIVGSLIPPHASSLGKCITANQPEALKDHLLRAFGMYAFTPQTIVDETQLNEEYIRVRENGYAIDREESTSEGCCFGAPIFFGNRVVAAISISFLKSRLTDEPKAIEAAQRSAITISLELSAQK